ncbi:structural protein [Synechococcus phage ACG-2014b]|uniref:Structural protein n=1 Tax=Synechococcus phage ACG-2014b TaxID=1493508 RepID=A0A0E3EZX6_9CAUD|nr:virion structural protein [Synechococcus phage ACG-2014b]AIX17954.1 structural protein [Synechococcus phage ACG-2014b]AIX18169.1 structural protein [Synechococcus phage ACG-2014b]AIX19327.1 structural protein [Synechococcus phage ACG-2014b]AIX19761.1 structural protein [Synechococcus phage ACG-2014b]AIX21990.1 structural protein [Synechococcus phage ACG-2014b]
MNINKVSNAVSNQLPDFIPSEYELFGKFIQYYYKSQEKTGLGQNILNNFLEYLDIDKLDIDILDGATILVEPIDSSDTTITVENIDKFLPENGSIKINDEVIFYEGISGSPNVSFRPGVSYEQVKIKQIELQSPLRNFDGTARSFALLSEDRPVTPISAQHLLVQVYGEYLVPGIDYDISGTSIVFTEAPRAVLTSDSSDLTSIKYFSGFVENNIFALNDISASFGDGKTEFQVTRNGSTFIPELDEYVIAYYDGTLLTPKVNYVFDDDLLIFRGIVPLKGRKLTLFYVDAPIPSFGSGAAAHARINNEGEITSINIDETGSSYRFDYPPAISIDSEEGTAGAAKALINGVKNLQLIFGGVGYSDTNPPIVNVEAPTQEGSTAAKLSATVVGGTVTGLTLTDSGSGYTAVPRITFQQPGGAVVEPPTIVNGSISGQIVVSSRGSGYTTAPEIYIDEPTGNNPIKASLETEITNGEVTAVNILNSGQGYTTTPRIKIIEPTGAQVLETVVDSDGRVITIEILEGGAGYDDVPSVYIIDDRTDASTGAYLGGSGAQAVASVFNGRITDINITEFGTGYSQTQPPKVIIQSPPQASASVEIGINEITGFEILQPGRGYSKAQFLNCARAASGITGYTEDGNAIFSNNTAASVHNIGDTTTCLDAVFVKRLLDKYTEQFLPNVPELDYKKIDVRTAIKNIKSFYQTKGTTFSIEYLFKLLYGETIDVSYPKDQIIKPSAATWSINTILRATLESGDPRNIQDALISQVADIADVNVQDASALVENYIAINTANTTIYELVLSEETIQGTFVVPYKTRLAEPLGEDDSIITVDSTIGWPERNGEFILGGSEVVRYKEKSLNQFIECTRLSPGSIGLNPYVWDSATEVVSNFKVVLNRGTTQEVVMNIVGIVDAQQTNLTDTGSYYLPGDKLTVAKLGGTGEQPLLTTWLYNVKKLIEVTGITFGGVDDRFATVTCSNNHGLLVGDEVTIYGANPIIYNGTFEVTSRDNDTVFQYQLPQTALVAPQGNILVSVNLNKGKSTNTPINNSISSYTTNIQNSFFNDNYVYVASTGIPNYNVGPFVGSALLPGNQRKLNRFVQSPSTISTKNVISPGPIGTWVNGVSVWSYKSTLSKTFGPITSITISNAGQDYDAASPPSASITGGGGSGATAEVVVNGSVSSISVDTGGSGYTSSPLVSIVGGGGSGASATAIITKGSVSNILITSGGTGYTSQPEITIVGGGGTGATGTASVRGPIKSVNLSSAGSSYISSPTVTVSSGVGAVAQAIVNNGRIISIAIISGGSGYTTAPEVQIQGIGFGAKAQAIIDTEGENAGKVTSIQIDNRGINYTQGTTVINLTSVGQDAIFSANVFQWTYNLQESATFDDSQGSVFEGYNTQYGGEYAHLSNPQRLRYILGDNLIKNNSDVIVEQETQLEHSPIIGWAFDGNPIYGPYGYTDPTDQSSNITKISSSHRLKTDLVFDDITNPTPVRTEGPLLSTDVAGTYVEDYEYVFNLGDLDQYNGRFCKTPQFPNGRYCYFVTIDNTEAGNAVFPYVLGSDFNSVVDSWNLDEDATQQNIPRGVVRYRDPYQNVDIDVERTPNASTNSLSLENGDILRFEVEDENRDGVISQDETDDPDEILEEPPLQIFDYFPKVKTESKVDIEVETISRFENASITDFVVENAGTSYQVDDKLIFNNDGTGGSGASARVSRIKGETINSFGYQYRQGLNYGQITTEVPHTLEVNDTIFVDYSENIETTNKEFSVRQLKGIEEVTIDQTGSGYNEDIPPTIVIDGDGESAELEAVVDSIGSIKTVNIINSGNSYTENPRVILSHPQIFKKADYFIAKFANQENVKVNDIFVNQNKETFICGSTPDDSGNTVAFIAKLSAGGVKEWEKTLELTSGLNYAELQKIYVEGNTVWVAGINKPNSSILGAYNPDIIVAKYNQSSDGLSATLEFQKAYAGISGASRSDNITSIIGTTDNRVIIGGFTNTNSPYPYDAFVGILDSSGTFTVKRKIVSSNGNEEIKDLLLDSAGNLYFLLETSTSQNAGDRNFAIGKATITNTAITTVWINEITNNAYSFLDISFAIDEFDDIYVTSTLQLKSDDTTRDSFWVGKYNTSGSLLWNYRYVAPGRDINLAPKCVLDIFSELNIAFTRVDNVTDKKTVDLVKLDYKGKIVNHTTNDFTENTVEGITVNSIDVDNSGDPYIFGQTSWNRNEAIFTFDSDLSDTTTHHTLTTLGLGGSIERDTDGYLKIFGFQTGASTVFENSAAKIAATSLSNALQDDFVIEFLLYKDAAGSNAETLSADKQSLIAIGDAQSTTGGLWLYYNTDGTANDGRIEMVVTNNSTIFSGASAATGTNTGLFADDTWQLISLRKESNTFKVYVNGIEQISATISDTSLGSKDIHIGNVPGFPSAGGFIEGNQGQFFIDSLRIRNRAVTVTAPSDFGDPLALPGAVTIALDHTFVDTAWFTQQHARYDYIDYESFGLKVDKNSDVTRRGTFNSNTNSNYGFTRTAVTPVTGVALTIVSVGYALAEVGFQTLDLSTAITTMSEGTLNLTYSRDVWSSRTATVPSPGSQKLKVTANVRNRYYFKTFNLLKIDNVQELTINQSFNFTVGAKLVIKNGASFVNSGYITRVDFPNKKVYVAINNNSWTNDVNVYELSTEQFDEQSTYNIVGPVPNDVNEIAQTFPDIVNTTPGTFDIDLATFDAPEEIGGTNNLDEYAKFKSYADNDYSVKIVEVSGSSSYVVGSVVTLTSSDVSFNSSSSTVQITNLTGVLKITLISNLSKILQVTAVNNSDTVYCVSDALHYLSVSEQIFVDGNPNEEVSGIVYDEYDGSFPVERVISPIEFTYKLPQNAVSSPATTGSSVTVLVKSPTLKMYYGHQYLFNLSHSSMLGGNLSFAKDPLYKLEYSFNSIERIGTPGVTGQGVPTPTVKFKVTEDVITNISYYFDPSRPGAADSPVISDSYLDVTFSPYVGTFTVDSTSGGTITTGDNTFQFILPNQPEAAATIANASYSTSSKKAVGAISNIRIVNPGGFYTKLPIVSSIESNRKIERVEINEPGTEYAVGTYRGVPISGDGEGGIVQIAVADGTDEEGVLIPGQIQSVVVTSPGKGYTVANIDIEAISGILGSGLTGSGAELNVIIPASGSGASLFTLGEEIGKIKNLKNNNFGFDYSHDYTLRPEISFPINAQLTATSILDSITVTDPGSGYTQAPTVVISGGGGTGAVAVSTIKNGRLFAIEVKDPGSGYSSQPQVNLKSSFNYVINIDLGLLQFAFPHGIQNGSEVTLNVTDTGEGLDFPLAAGAIGRLNGSNTYYAIAGAANSLEDDQLKLAITSANAELGDAISYVNAGTGRQSVLTESFGGAAEANVITSTFLEGELVYQGDTLENATAQGYVSTNSGWQVGPRILKMINYTGTFTVGQTITGVISKSSGVISKLKIARGVLEVGSITKTTGQFVDDVGKPSEIIQKIQDSYYYQDFSYAVKSSVSISEWKDVLVRNVHPASFKVFGELSISDFTTIPNKETDFELTKSVELANEAIVPNIQNFTLVEPIYSEFNNTEILFRQKRLTSSENILTSVVQRIDDISNLFDGVRTAFPLTVNNGDSVIASANQLMVIMNGVVQTPEVAFELQSDSIVFSEPPAPPASVKYVNVQISPITIIENTFASTSGIVPTVGQTLTGTGSGARLTITRVTATTVNIGSQENPNNVQKELIEGFFTEGSAFSTSELVLGNTTGFSALFETAVTVANNGLFEFGESVSDLSGDTAIIEDINLEKGSETPIAKLRYTVGPSTTSFETIDQTSDINTPAPVASGVFVVDKNYQIGSEIIKVTGITQNSESTTLTVVRGQLGTSSGGIQQSTPLYGTDITITNDLTLSKTVGTYQSKPGLYDILLDEVIIGAKSRVVARITSTTPYVDPATNAVVEQVEISEGSSFFALLFDRIQSTTYPNIVLDDISESQIAVVEFDNNTVDFNTKFPENELINHYILPYDNETGDLQDNEYIRNYKIEYGNESGNFVSNEDLSIRKLALTNEVGEGFFSLGQILRSRDTKAEIIGYNQAQKTLYLGKLGRINSTGLDIHNLTFAGNAALSTTQTKFGLTSLSLDGTGDYISESSSSDYGVGTSGYTLEAWVRPAAGALTGTAHLVDMRTTGTEVALRLYIEAGQVRLNVNGTDVVTSGAITLVADTWAHVAVVRDGTDMELFIDGASVGTGTDANTYTAKPIVIGSSYNNADAYEGYIDELRFSNVARYTAAFTPRTGIFQGDINTKLLLHFDGANGDTYSYDWSGSQDFTFGEEFNNDAINATTNANGSAVVAGFTGNTHRYYDAATLLDNNKKFIAKEVVYLLTQQYPSLTIPGGNVNCEDDIEDIIEALVEDLRNGSNNHIWDASALYVDRTDVNAVALNHVETEIDETVWAYNKLGDFIPYIINNVLWTVSGSHGLTQYTDTTLTDSNNTVYAQFTPTAATYNASTGEMELTIGTHSLTTSSQISLSTGGIVFTCSSDNDVTQHAYPRSDDPAHQSVLKVSATTATTITINVGASPSDQQYTHVFVSAATNSVSLLNYTTGDCSDVASTADNLLDILIDTLTNADLASPVDHLGTITKVSPAVEYSGATVDSFYEETLQANYTDNANDILYTNKIGASGQYRFRDAANLIRSNRTAIVDKAAFDMLTRYPDLTQSMPRNADGTSTAGTERCKADLGLILDDIATDIENGGNKTVATTSKFYIGNNNVLQHIRLQVWQSVYAHERLGFYAKQAINGDLTTDNTDELIIGDWGITNDAGQCANVQTAIDNLVTLLNDTIAPTGADFGIAADRLHFNRDFMAEEATGLLDNEFTYVLNNVTYRAFDYPNGTAGRTKCQRDLKLIIISAISDLQTGGTNSTIDAIELYFKANLQLDHIEDQLSATIFAIESLRNVGLKAIENLLYSTGSAVTGDQYSGQYASSAAFRDSESMTNVEAVKSRWGELIDIAVRILSPAGIPGRYASQQMLFNKNYYKTEITNTIVDQFGQGTWQYDTFLDGLVDNLSHDIIITDTSSSNTTEARRISLSREGVVSELVFTAGAGYQSLPTIAFTAPSAGITAAAVATLEASGPLSSITITDGGAGYTLPPDITLSGTNVTNDGLTAILTSDSVTSMVYDGRVWDADDFTSVGTGTEAQDAGTGTGTTGGFAGGGRHVRFGAASGTRFVVTDGLDTTGYDKFRAYVIAGNGSNGGDAPETGTNNEDLELYYRVGAGAWTYVQDLISASNVASFATWTAVEANLPAAAKASNVSFKIQQTYYEDSVSFDHYGLKRLGVIDDAKEFEGDVTISVANAAEETASTTEAAASFITLREVNSVTITNPGRGYDPASPPTATFSGGNPSTPATISNINVVLDTSRFTNGETLTSSGGGTAQVLEDTGNAVYIGPITGTVFADADTLTGGTSGVTSTIPSSGVGTVFDYYTNVGNVLTFNDARLIQSPIESEFSVTNLWTNPEAFEVNWTTVDSTFAVNDILAPDGTQTAEKIIASVSGTNHGLIRDYSLNQFTTMDSGNVTFDSGTDTFDTGSVSNEEDQTFTSSVFVKSAEYSRVRFVIALDEGLSGEQTLFFDVNMADGSFGSIFQTQGGLISYEMNTVPFGDGWYRIYATLRFSFGFSTLRTRIRIKNENNQSTFSGDGSSGIYVWGAKLNKGVFDAYTAVGGKQFFSNTEYNVKLFALDLLEDYIESALDGALATPTPNGSYAFDNTTWRSAYNTDEILTIVRENVQFYRNQLGNSTYYVDVTVNPGITIPAREYGITYVPTGAGGGLNTSDYFYGQYSDQNAELESVILNEAQVAKVYKRFRIDGDITDGPYTMGESIVKQGDSNVTGLVYGFHEDENYKYLDVEITGGTWTINDVIQGSANTTIATLSSIENRLHIIKLKGDFVNDIPFYAYTSEQSALPTAFYKNEAAVLDNRGGKLTVDTATLNGTFDKNSVVYSSSTELYIDVQQYEGLDVKIGDKIISGGNVRYSFSTSVADFTVGHYIYKLNSGGGRDASKRAIITGKDTDNNYLYVAPIDGTFVITDSVGDFGAAGGGANTISTGTISTVVTTTGSAAALIGNIVAVGVNKRLYLTSVIGTWGVNDYVVGKQNYKSVILDKVISRARVKRAFRGFDGTQTTFDLSISNGTAYLPDPAGHMLIFVNGILQPPGAGNAYNAFSDKIQFAEAPDPGSTFTGFYVGKLRQLDDISFEFDSLRQSFNLKRDDVFYSLTLTEGVQSTTIRPENNIIVSLNGVIQEPGVGFEIVGSRIIFSEIPRVGSSFAAFSYVGSEADVDAAEVVPPVEPGDFLEIQGETEDREVAVIESSNSLITFDYLGSVFGQNAEATAVLTSGFIQKVSVTSPGSAYTSRPVVRVDSISGFNADIRAIVGINTVEVNNTGSGYKNSTIEVETEVPDDWTAPNLADYGEETVDYL